MLHIIKQMPAEIVEFCNDIVNGSINFSKLRFMGWGDHGDVYGIEESNFVIKLFNGKAVSGEHFDYIYLNKLQGIEEIPIMYAFAEEKFVVMERIDGLKILDYLENNKKCTENIYGLIKAALTKIYSRKISLVDLKINDHFFWLEKEKKIKIIDFGVCDDNSILSDEEIEDELEEILNDVYEELETFLETFNEEVTE